MYTYCLFVHAFKFPASCVYCVSVSKVGGNHLTFSHCGGGFLGTVRLSFLLHIYYYYYLL